MFTKADIEKYFMAEKQAGMFFMVIGVIALLLAIAFFFFLKTGFYKGAAIPLLLIGLIELAVGFTVYKRSDADRIRNVYAYDMNPGQLQNQELPRMKTVNRNFIIYRWVEIVLVVCGLALIYFFRSNPTQAFWFGIGLTLSIQAIIMLVADQAAETRAKLYTKGMEQFIGKLK